MKQSSGDALARLVERKTGGDAAEDSAADLIRGSFVPRHPSSAEVERIWRAVTTRSFSREGARVALRVALTLGCLLAGAATVKGYEMARRAGWLGEARPAPAAKPAPARKSQHRGAPKVALVRAPVVDDVPAPVLAPVSDDAREPETQSASPAVASHAGTPAGMVRGRESARPAQARPVLAQPPLALAPSAQGGMRLSPEANSGPTEPPAIGAQPWATSPSPGARASAQPPAISQDVLEMDRAMGYLRRDRNPAAALGALDNYLGRYPHGALAKEARLARIDALLMLGRYEQALNALEATIFDPGLRSTELLVVRAELRAAQDCRRAEEDFGTALGRGPDARLLERILYGRGACRTKLHDLAGANDDLGRYLERFPEGPHADWARRWMAGRRPSSDLER